MSSLNQQLKTDTPYYLTNEFKLMLDKITIETSKYSETGLTPSNYKKSLTVLMCYDTAKMAIKKLTS